MRPPRSGRAVVITGMAAMTALAGDLTATWQRLLSGSSGIGELEPDLIDRYQLPVTIGGRLKPAPDTLLTRIEQRRLAYTGRLALRLSRVAWRAAGSPGVDHDRLAVAIGTALGDADVLVTATAGLETGGYRKVSPLAVQQMMPNGAAAAVALDLGARAGIHTPVAACASGAEAIAHAWRLIAGADADIVVAGGVEKSFGAVPLAAFAVMRALSTRTGDPRTASRPFDRDRDGFVLGEAGALLVLEDERHARARGATIHARLLGAGITSDAYNTVAPDPSGTHAARAMTQALRTAGLAPAEVGHVNAHATATPLGDLAEARAIGTAIGRDASIYAPKSALGHALGAAGAVEAALTVLSIREGLVPPTLNLDHQDPEIDLDIVHGTARAGAIDAALSNSFGFGGHNVCLAFGRA
ncbi:KasA/KasB family beta-ketoacyl-ACP synthase [Nocardia sp. NPDC051832]|uniref:KasA/KasB family beta-ketoacyl-ACP synthase n=1 Tax=Nocardia sp. NPDC051832 TaxID=3155673 RepID=UPI0034129A46